MKVFVKIWLLFLLQSFFSPAFADLQDHEIDKLLLCYKAKISASPDQEKYQRALKYFPHTELYKLFIDKDRLENPEENEKQQAPHLIFDVREPGYFYAMDTTFARMGEEIGRPVNFDYIVETRDRATYGLDGFAQGFLIGKYSFGSDAKLSSRAFKELFASKILFQSQLFLNSLHEKDEVFSRSSLYGSLAKNLGHFGFVHRVQKHFLARHSCAYTDGECRIRGQRLSKVQLVEKLEPLFTHYYQSVDRASSMMDALMAIGELLRALEVTHFLPDGNLRTYAFVMLTKLLIENGMPPAILNCPYIFSGSVTVSDMAFAIKAGVKNFLNDSAEYQRVFLEHECADMNVDDTTWLSTATTYLPYYQKQAAAPLIDDAKKQITTALDSAIAANVANQPLADFNELMPLSVACLLKSEHYVAELLKIGAHPLGSPWSHKYYTSLNMPLATAADMGYPPIILRMVQSLSLEQWRDVSPGHLSFAIVDTVKSKLDDDERNRVLDQLLLPALGAQLDKLRSKHETFLLQILQKWVKSDGESQLRRSVLITKHLGQDWAL